ncbi:MAG: TetR family transcriptional regulator C-terminal domain-containing protein [Solirubrobacteraceae bacterium]
MFEPDLREQLRAACDAWVELVAGRIREGLEDGSIRAGADPQAAAERLTATVDGLSARWLAGLLERDHARDLLAGAVCNELAPQ